VALEQALVLALEVAATEAEADEAVGEVVLAVVVNCLLHSAHISDKVCF